MRALPNSVVDYIEEIGCSNEKPDYVQLDLDNNLVGWGGGLSEKAFSVLESAALTVSDLPFLEGLLPLDRDPLVLPNVQMRSGGYVDIHLFADSQGQWVLLFDCTERAQKAQLEQQIRLDDLLDT